LGLFRLPGRSFFEHREQHPPHQPVEGPFVRLILTGFCEQYIEQPRA
jgi:hypothetical protein